MKHLSSILLAAALIAAGTTACFTDPTESDMNGPERIDLSRAAVFINQGDSLTVQAEVKDGVGNVFNANDAAWESSDANVAVARKDTVVIPGGAFSRVFIRAVAAGQAYIRITTNGLTDSLRAVVIPPTFTGTVGPATASVGDTITITGTSVLTFSTTAGALSEVTVGGEAVWVVSRTANALKFISFPATTADEIAITNVVLLGSVVIAELPATSHITVTEADEPANDDPATPSTLTLYSDYYGVVSGSDADDYIAFTTPATSDSVGIEIEWLSDADLDIGLLLGDGSGACAALTGACYSKMGTGDNPETAAWRLAANTTYQFDVWVYDSGSSPYAFYRIRTTKIN